MLKPGLAETPVLRLPVDRPERATPPVVVLTRPGPASAITSRNGCSLDGRFLSARATFASRRQPVHAESPGRLVTSCGKEIGPILHYEPTGEGGQGRRPKEVTRAFHMYEKSGDEEHKTQLILMDSAPENVDARAELVALDPDHPDSKPAQQVFASSPVGHAPTL